jgi:hypothetical protein
MKTILFAIHLTQLLFIGYQNDRMQKQNILSVVIFTDQNDNDFEALLVKKSVLQKKASMLVPQEFVLMDVRTIALKYPSVGHRPSEVYTNQEGTINIALNHTKNAANESGLEGVKKVMDAQFNEPSIEFIKSEMKEMNVRKLLGQFNLSLDLYSPPEHCKDK